jgi:hypothetical protein
MASLKQQCRQFIAMHPMVTALGVIIILMASRQAALLLEPRLWCEEATTYLRYALRYPALDTLLATHKNYYSLIANAASFLQAHAVPLEYAPFISTYLAFAAMLIPHLIIWGGHSPYWRDNRQKILASAIILFVAQACEIWMNVINSQFHLSLSVFLLLAEDWKNRSRRCHAAYGLLMLLAAFSGVVSCFLTPLFLIKLYVERSGLGKILVGVLLAACTVHALVILWEMHHPQGRGTRFEPLKLMDFLMSLTRYTLGTIFLGTTQVMPIHWPHPHTIQTATALLAGLCCFFALPLPGLTRLYFLGAFMLLAGLSIATSLNGDGGFRYSYAPSVILMLMVQQSLYLPPTALNRLRRWLAAACLAVALLVGLQDYYFRYFCYDAKWPDWTQGVEKWRADPMKSIAVHPQYPGKNWNLILRPDDPVKD